MGRQARRLSESGMYHVIFRGISRQNIFEEESDYEKMAEIITKVKKAMSFEIFAYCFMSNHVHLFLKEKEMGEISKIRNSLGTCHFLCEKARIEQLVPRP